MPVKGGRYARMLTNQLGTGVIFTFRYSLHELTCDELECNWNEMEQTFSVSRRDHIAMLVPDAIVDCDN
jgi:hypothetical protein